MRPHPGPLLAALLATVDAAQQGGLSQLGAAVDSTGDMDGDGLADVLAGAPVSDLYQPTGGVPHHATTVTPGPYWQLTLTAPNQPPLAVSFSTLDPSGQAAAIFTAPVVGPQWVGFVFHHACVVFDAGFAVVHASNAASHAVTP